MKEKDKKDFNKLVDDVFTLDKANPAFGQVTDDREEEPNQKKKLDSEPAKD